MTGNEKNRLRDFARKPLFYIVIGLIALAGGMMSHVLTTSSARPTSFTTSDGQTYTWELLQGHWVVINYFAPWCAPCLREIPQLNAFYAKQDARIKIFAINYDPANLEEIKGLKKQYNIQFPVIAATADTRLPVAVPPVLPATYLINPQGQVSQRLLGEVTVQRLQQALDDAGLQPL